jgi:hypothetical protein
VVLESVITLSAGPSRTIGSSPVKIIRLPASGFILKKLFVFVNVASDKQATLVFLGKPFYYGKGPGFYVQGPVLAIKSI